ncbi:MAG TPA: branched-chain amino acid transaminase [Candidatus Limnocylindria bacterium]|nr:branched-chain amino acid transaminase [Candidatus Limnocylindria bacterium]
MAITKVSKIWMSGKWVAWDDAKIHILAHVAHYASSVFEGIRCYDTARGPAIFRLDEHVDRLMYSAKIYRMELPFTRQQIRDVCVEVVAVNELKECYLRPLIYRGYENLGVNPFGSPVEVSVAAFPWGKYLGDDALTKGVAAKVSSWWRFAPNTLPAMAKASANYMNSQLMKMEALVDGYGEAIALDVNGFVSEGSGQNVFAVIKGEVVTPPLSSSILAGITRDTVMTLARDLGYRVREEVIPREMLYVADELFYSGTAVEISPINSVDRIQVGSGERGPVTKALQEAFFGAVRGQQPDRHGWLTLVPQPAGVTAASRRP